MIAPRLTTAAGFLLSAPLFAAPPTGGITRQVWTGVGGSEVSNLTSLASFPNSPNQTGTLTSFDAPRDSMDNYGARILGWVHAPVTGNYRFYIHSDDSSDLWLSTTESPDQKRRIAGVSSWVSAGQWNGSPDQTSVEIPLVAGRYYYIEALHKEGGGGDHLGVGWTYPGQSSITYIPGSRLSTWQNVAPIANNDTGYVRPGSSTILRVLDNDLDPNGIATLNLSSLAIVTPPVHGTATVRPDGKIDYVHTGTGTGTDSLTYEIRDTPGLISTATVSIQITDALRLPLASSKMPANPPPQQIAAVNAFPNIGFSDPLAIATPPGETNRLFIVEKGGDIEVIPNLAAPALASTPFLDLDAIVNPRNSIYGNEDFVNRGESGLLGLAFHPDYATNGRFFVFYSVEFGGSIHQRVSEFARSATNPNQANPASEKILIQQQDAWDNHNGGDLHFGNDGFLYISLGDEGDQNDSENNSQRIDKDFFSGIMRIDVDFDPANYNAGTSLRPNTHSSVIINSVTGNPNYKVPGDNPWVGATSFNGLAVTPANVRTEFWAVGLRNPWRFSFDRQTGDLWCADVGGGSWEEINKIVKGGNYEWAYKEGASNGPKWNSRPSGWTGAQGPVYAYGHGSGTFQGNSVTGGVVYRGTTLPALTGRYIFADYSSGNIWAMNTTTAAVERISGEGGIAGFGLDPSNGDVLIADLNGQIRRLVNQAVDTGFPATLDATGLFGDVATLTPAAGMVGYDVNLPFWSDHAKKRRWFGITSPTATLGFNAEGAWDTPAGTVWVKHFDMEMQRGTPSSAKRLETRVFVRNATGAYGVSYRWNAAGTQANLVNEAGEEFDLSITVNGTPTTQRWRIPSRAECMTCHSAEAGLSLSFRTRQLNLAGQIGGESGNFIQLLSDAGYLDGLDDSPLTLAKHVAPSDTAYSLETRARAWLDVNCAYCHMDGGTAPVNFDARAEVPLFSTDTVNVMPSSGVLHPNDRLLAPGQEERSVIVHRSSARNGYTRMPPLATNVVDEEGMQLLKDWIDSELPDRQSFATWVSQRLGGRPAADQGGTADPDGDGRDNLTEFLELTDPLAHDRGPSPATALDGEDFQLTVPSLPGRGVKLETSTNLADWSIWNTPGNDGLERSGSTPWQIAVPVSGDRLFFRARIEER
ncbi:PQQ-dependent sugar dehydrogenase [Luteolibacter flavescens]|uniref:PQQ-dependent sugar dehydrogenase n=1 Tax=Luteolibacter flavescens TaxID=1859460 RepID=A0ABT3FRF7_9BACT|nr:PQQ-dependent sugar dehydrogenase [Luteolibacter flavescens]MCW1885816.1 PQQ-dependent sugar dehydrogenase [Luteolibacter flavescens]